MKCSERYVHGNNPFAIVTAIIPDAGRKIKTELVDCSELSCPAEKRIEPRVNNRIPLEQTREKPKSFRDYSKGILS